MSGAKIIKALQDAEAGGFSCVLVDGRRWWREDMTDLDRDTVTIPRSQYEALRAAAEVIIDMAAGLARLLPLSVPPVYWRRGREQARTVPK